LTGSTPERGEVWVAGLDPVAPSEQGGTRPVLVVSTTAFNAWPVGLVVLVPITTRDRGFAHHVRVAGGGLDRVSFAMPEYVRSIAQRRLQRRLGVAKESTMVDVDDWLRRIAAL
jgi:mRNA interferase MazF